MNLIKRIHSQIKTDIVTLDMINSILDDKSEDSRKGLIKRACQKGDLVRIRNGLYVVGEEEQRFGYSKFTLANHIRMPSYISMESALSYYNLIPEAVYTTTSVTSKKSLIHESEVGIFSYSYLRQDYFNFGFFQMKDSGENFLIADPLKALMDYIVILGKKYNSVDELVLDLRFDWEEFVGFEDFVNVRAIDLNALKEITQEVILFALSQTDFFNNAFFCGGTSLRILHGLNRFSEDLDFTALDYANTFNFDDYIEAILKTLNDYGLKITMGKSKDDSFVKSRALKEDSEKWKLHFPTEKRMKKVMIKLEIDTNPPEAAITMMENLDFPVLHRIKCGTFDTLFAGKIHALLCRPYTKGRDWYDFLFYVSKKEKINLEFLKNALYQTGPYMNRKIDVTYDFIKKELHKKISEQNWKQVARDVLPFIKRRDISSLELWEKNLFLEKLKMIWP